MNDLLNEEEFLLKEYNPRKRFWLFALSGACINVAGLLTLKHFDFDDSLGNYILSFCILIISPLLSLLCIFSSNKMHKISSRTRNLGIMLIFTLPYFGLIIPAIIASYNNVIIANIWLAAVILLGINMISYSIVAGTSGAIIKLIK